MASYQELLDVIARVGAVTGDDRAWMMGLSGADLAVVTNPVSVVSPSAIDNVVAAIRAQHRAVFDRVSPAAQPPVMGEGRAAQAIRSAETSLAQQHSTSAQLDLQVIAAVLNAHTSHGAGRAALDALQADIETAVATRTDLDTPTGARAFQRYLIGKLRDIKTVVETAGLDDTSQAALAAALASLYAGATAENPDIAGDRGAESKPPAPAGVVQPAPAADIPADLLVDPLLADDLAPASEPSAPAQPVAAPMAPPVAGMPALGGAGPPAALPLPSGLAGLASPPPPRLTGEDSLLGDPLLDEPLHEPGEPGETDAEGEDLSAADKDAGMGDEPAGPAPDGETSVRLPNGETVTAPSPQLAAAITAAVAGTPIAEAFRQQGIAIPAPGTPVPHPVDPAQVIPGDIGMLTDRHAVALGNGKAVFNNQIQPIASVSGPSFLGWEHPPEPGAGISTTRTDQPTPTRPAVTAGPPIGE
ncbi:DUF4226 domain-containing protein [Mycobacterium sp. shizuoka-1]|uniref:DUF4226 domain-containing protein n=1 Tax=Mycobacterium sp. shizuoka-1 TaxID=2039281 RepID=UPI000C066014|nr:DUF4226 domain-containing protein [Mycobacterium sp. shizuoka-1]GAY13955.1 hypothetical protein MSZK_06810 [Mycobacterium sp. shizuoka-1]